ncbi:MAG TPA: methyltransferase domain-containing protein [Actinomycetota bacterium]|nr:methyltransferase domain-containing protein [Actinomycetota bacterium]
MAKTGTDAAIRKWIVDYYDGSWFDYRVVWLNRGTLAKHFGYWEPHIRNHAESLLNMNKQVAARVNPKPGERVLDAGCGVGGSSIWLARTFGLNTVGISLSEKELERARRYAKERGLEAQCTFEVQDFVATTFPDESFDIVWAQESFCHAMDKGAWMKEMFRLLKPGGRLVIEDWFRPRRPYHPADEAMFREWLRGWAIEDLATRDEVVEDARAAGFADTRLDDITPHVIRSVRRLYGMTVALFPGAYLGKLVKLRSEVLHRNIVSARLQWRARNRNLWISGIFSARKPEAPEEPKPSKRQAEAEPAPMPPAASTTSAEPPAVEFVQSPPEDTAGPAPARAAEAAAKGKKKDKAGTARAKKEDKAEPAAKAKAEHKAEPAAESPQSNGEKAAKPKTRAAKSSQPHDERAAKPKPRPASAKSENPPKDATTGEPSASE